jgi:hypothetical protein
MKKCIFSSQVFHIVKELRNWTQRIVTSKWSYFWKPWMNYFMLILESKPRIETMKESKHIVILCMKCTIGIETIYVAQKPRRLVFFQTSIMFSIDLRVLLKCCMCLSSCRNWGPYIWKKTASWWSIGEGKHCNHGAWEVRVTFYDLTLKLNEHFF